VLTRLQVEYISIAGGTASADFWGYSIAEGQWHNSVLYHGSRIWPDLVGIRAIRHEGGVHLPAGVSWCLLSIMGARVVLWVTMSTGTTPERVAVTATLPYSSTLMQSQPIEQLHSDQDNNR
jgi:hypothetical protein